MIDEIREFLGDEAGWALITIGVLWAWMGDLKSKISKICVTLLILAGGTLVAYQQGLFCPTGPPCKCNPGNVQYCAPKEAKPGVNAKQEKTPIPASSDPIEITYP